MKPKIEVKILNEPVLKTYIVSPEKQKAFLKKAIVQKDKITQLNKSDSIKEHVSQVKKVVKNKQATNLINKPKQKISSVSNKEGESKKIKSFKKLNPYAGLNNIMTQDHTRFVESKAPMSGKSQIGRVTVPKEHKKQLKSEVLVQSTTGNIFKQDGKCYVEVFGSQMSKLGMPSGTVPCPGEKSVNEAAYETAMNKWLKKQ